MSMPPRITLIDAHTQDWQCRITQSRVFACYVSRRALACPLLWEQLAYVKQLGKPVLAFLEAGVTVPEGLFAGIVECEVHTVTSPAAMAAITMAYLNAHMEEDPDA